MAAKPGHTTGLGRRASDQRRRDIHHDDPAFGYRFIADELPARGDHRRREPGRPAVLVSSGSARSSPGNAGLSRRAGPPVHDDLVERSLHRDGAEHQLWLTDITEHRTDEGKLYLCAVKDAALEPDRRLLHRLTDGGLTGRLSAAERRLAARYASRDGGPFGSRQSISLQSLHRLPAREQPVGSMGRVGAAGDNAAMESFFALLQRNVLDRQRWSTRHELRLAIITWIERTYHRRRTTPPRQAHPNRI